MGRNCKVKEKVFAVSAPDGKAYDNLIDGYKEMSRINLSLAEESVTSDNDALDLAEQNLAERE